MSAPLRDKLAVVVITVFAIFYLVHTLGSGNLVVGEEDAIGSTVPWSAVVQY